MEAAGNAPAAVKGKEALQTLDELIAGAKKRQKIQEATSIDVVDNQHINQELQQQSALLLELATKHSETVNLENEMWQTYYRARSSRLILTCKPNKGMKEPDPVFPHKKGQIQ